MFRFVSLVRGTVLTRVLYSVVSRAQCLGPASNLSLLVGLSRPTVWQVASSSSQAEFLFELCYVLHPVHLSDSSAVSLQLSRRSVRLSPVGNFGSHQM